MASSTQPTPAATPNNNEGGRLSRAHWLTLLAAFLGWMFDGVEMGIFPLVARPALQELLGGQAENLVGLWMGRITALFLLGAAAGGLVFGWLGDKIGRVRAMSLSILVYSVFSGACYFADSPWHLAGLRFLSALGMGGEWSLGVALVMETWPERHRPLLAGVIGAAANLGFLLIGVIGYVFPITPTAWRWVMLVGAAPAVLTFLIRMFVPESEQWQQAKARATTDPLREMFRPPYRRVSWLAILLVSVVLIGTWGSVQWIPVWADKLTGGLKPEAKALCTMLIAAGSVVGCFVGSMLGGLGRRAAYSGLALASFLACALLFRLVHEYGALLLGLTFLVGLLTSSFFGWLPLYLPELFPTRMRATAQGVAYNAGRIFAAAGAIGAGQLVGIYHGDYARMGAMITLVYIGGAVLVWFAPETKGKPLPG